MIGHIMTKMREAISGPPIVGRGVVSRALKQVYADPEVQSLVRSYSLDPRQETGSKLRHRAMEVIMTRTAGHINPQTVTAIVREEFPNVW